MMFDHQVLQYWNLVSFRTILIEKGTHDSRRWVQKSMFDK